MILTGLYPYSNHTSHIIRYYLYLDQVCVYKCAKVRFIPLETAFTTITVFILLLFSFFYSSKNEYYSFLKLPLQHAWNGIPFIIGDWCHWQAIYLPDQQPCCWRVRSYWFSYGPHATGHKSLRTSWKQWISQQ